VDLLTLKNVERQLLREYLDQPGLNLSLAQTARLLGVDASTCKAVLHGLVEARYLACDESGMYVRRNPNGNLEPWKTLVRNRLAILARTPLSRVKTSSGRGRPHRTEHRIKEPV
jgi:hypothetical protein